MPATVLLCTDLDRTLLPNGSAPESTGARKIFHRLSEHDEVCLAYVTGRHLALVESAIKEYELPVPDFIISDVGTRIYRRDLLCWSALAEWESAIDKDWNGYAHRDLETLFNSFTELALQEPEKQNAHKLSYYLSLDTDRESLLGRMQTELGKLAIRASLIWSIDEPAGKALLDVLPVSATKLGGLRFLMSTTGHTTENTLFAGDSGNDIEVLCSEIPSVLVANASGELRTEVRMLAAQADNSQSLYEARGDFHGLNGNYSAGILEGLAHFYPETESWMR